MTTLQKQLFQQLRSKNLFNKAQNYALNYLDDVQQQRVFPSEQSLANLSVFDEMLPSETMDPDKILDLLHQVGSKATVAQNAGRYFGFVNGGALPITMAVSWLASVWDQNAALYVMSPIAAKLEQVCESWLIQLLGLPQHCVAGFVSGTSTATFCGLAAARYKQLQKHNWNINIQGLFGAPKLRLILGKQTHGTVVKAAALLGIGQQNIEWVDCDDQGRMDVHSLPELDESCILVLQASNVNSGAFDDFLQICGKAKQGGAWVHIDGAFGLWAAASSRFSNLCTGIELADSWSVDAHKTLNTPYDCGVILCQDSEALSEALQQKGSYIQHSEQRDSSIYTPEMSRRARGVELWSALKYLGKTGIASLVEQLHDHAQYFAHKLREHNFNVLNEVVFNQVIICCDTNNLTQITLKNIQASGECWCGGSVWFGRHVIRISICSWHTTSADIDRTIDVFVQARKYAISSVTQGEE
jgi:glutamate/tyrosine decarboxylase-like PLP-dependent enzyme